MKITAPHQRTLLATLAMKPGRSVGLNEICRALWDTDYSEELDNSLRPLVTRVRVTLGAGRGLLATEPGAYRLEAHPDDIDVLRFGSIFKKGSAAYTACDWQRCLELLDQAAEIWTDEPFADIRSPSLRVTHVDSLNAQLSLLRPRRIEAFIRVSPHHVANEVLHDLGVLIRKDPEDQHLRWLNMLALYRSGQPNKALNYYTETRDYLVNEHGDEPMQSLCDLQKLMLTRDGRLRETPFLG